MARRRPRAGSGFTPVSKPVVVTAPPTLKTTLVFLGITLYLGTTVFRLCVQEFNLLKQAQILQDERTTVVAQHRDLQAQIASAKSNAGIERLAREQLGLVMALEVPVKTMTPQQAPAVQKAPTPQALPQGLPPAMAALVKLFAPPWQ